MRGLLTLGVLVAACGPSSPPVIAPPSEPAPAAPVEPMPSLVIAAEVAEPMGIVADAAHVWWATSDGQVWRAPAAGGAAPVAIAEVAGARDLALARGVLHVMAIDGVHRLDPGGPVHVVDSGEPNAMVVTGDTIVLSLDEELVAFAGGARRVLARARTVALASDGAHVYWVEPDSVRRVPLAGGAVEVIADRQFLPADVAVVGERVCWTSADGELLMCAPRAGGRVATGLRGSGAALAADDDGAVVLTTTGAVLELAWRRRAADVHATAAGIQALLAISADAVFVADQIAGRIVRYPRGRSQVTAVATARGHVTDIALAGDELLYLDAHHDDRADRLMAVPSRGGKARRIATLDIAGDLLAAGGGHLVVADQTTPRLQVIGGATIALEATPLAIAVDAAQLYWVEAERVATAPIDGGEIRSLYTHDGMRLRWSGKQAPVASLEVRGDVVLAAWMGFAGAVRVTGGAGEVVVEDARLAAGVGDRVVAWDDATGLSLDGAVLLPVSEEVQLFPGALAADADHAWLTYEDSNADSWLVEISLGKRESRRLVERVPGGRLVLGADALYFTSRDHPALVFRLDR